MYWLCFHLPPDQIPTTFLTHSSLYIVYTWSLVVTDVLSNLVPTLRPHYNLQVSEHSSY